MTLWILTGMGCSKETTGATSEPGSTTGTRGFVEYLPGSLPLIIAVPHGGYEEPDDLSWLEGPRQGRDENSLEAALHVMFEIEEITGEVPHMILNHLHADILNAAASQEDGAGEHPDTQAAWEEFHTFIRTAKTEVISTWGSGHFIDFQANGHGEGWTGVGVGLTAAALSGEADAIRASCTDTTVAHLCTTGADLLELTQGATSLGGLLSTNGHLVVPSPDLPTPGDGNFSKSNWNTWEHGSHLGGRTDATLLDNHQSLLTEENRAEYSRDLAETIISFLNIHYGADLPF
jgi:hypothetical protein